MRVLLLGGTSEAQELARALSLRDDVQATLSLAGRTANPARSPLPTRVGGFGGIEGLTLYLQENRIDALVDATHPFAAQMSAHAVAAAEAAQVPLAVLTRPAWSPAPGDDWREVADISHAVEALGPAPRRVFLTVGRLQAPAFHAAPQHHYVLRSIDAPEALPPQTELVLARPPFTLEDELALMQSRAIEILVSKNSGGAATAPKLEAARKLGISVVMLRRPTVAARTVLYNIEAALHWLQSSCA